MPKSSAFDNDFLLLIFNAVSIANVADNASSSPITSLYVSLHTADPTVSGNQQSNEATYTSYGRVAVARTAGGWSVVGSAVSNNANVTFNTCTGGSNTVTYVGIGTLVSGSGKLLYSGALSSSLAVSNGITPQFGVGNLAVSES